MPVKITATIDGLSEAEYDRIRAGGTGSRYEVVLDWVDGDHHGLELHFRLVDLTATQPIEYHSQAVPQPYPDEAWEKPAGVRITLEEPAGLPAGEYRGAVERVHYRAGDQVPVIELALSAESMDRIKAAEQERYPLRTAHFGGLGGGGPVFEMPVQNRPGDLLVSRLAEVVAALVNLTKISPRVLGIPDGPAPLGERIYLYLTGGEQAMGKHGDGKPADSKPGGSKGGGAHEKGGKGK